MLKHAIASARDMKRDENGGVAVLFGLSVIAICMFIGLAFDFGRTYASREKIAAAVDAASLAAAKGMRLDDLTEAQAISLARTIFDENMRGGAGNWTEIHAVRITVDKAKATAHVEVDSSVRTTFGALAGIQHMGAPGIATAIFESRDIEVSVQLDMTGSMCSPCTKRDDLKAATRSLVDILLPDTPTGQKVRVAFAPFSAGVNVGTYLTAVNGNRWSSNNCVYERQSTANEVSDNAPTGTDAYKVRGDLSGGVQSCPGAEIVPLTSNKTTLTNAIATFSASGSTAGQLGASWAWNLLSPQWASIWPGDSRPAAYGDAHTDKIVILMTDGVYNTIGGINYGDQSTQATQASSQSVEMCTKMKEAGITVYTVGFDLNSISPAAAKTRAVNTLKSCAGRGNSSSTGFFYTADNGAELDTAFRNIAHNIMTLRLSN